MVPTRKGDRGRVTNRSSGGECDDLDNVEMGYGINIAGAAKVSSRKVTFEGTERHQRPRASDIESIAMEKFRQGDFDTVVTVDDGHLWHCKMD